MKKSSQIMEKVFDILGEVLAVLTIVLYVVLIINANWSFIPDGQVLNILMTIRTYAALVVTLIVGFEAMVKRSFVFKVLFLLVVAIIIIFQFFPGTWANITKLA